MKIVFILYFWVYFPTEIMAHYSVKFLSGVIDNKPALIQVMTRRWSGKTSLNWSDQDLPRHMRLLIRNKVRLIDNQYIVWAVIVRRAGLLWSQQDFEWRWSVPLFKCLTVLEFSVILFDLCLLITFFNFIMNYVPIVTFWIFTYHKIWILSIMFCFIWSYWIIYFLACLEVSWRVVS